MDRHEFVSLIAAFLCPVFLIIHVMAWLGFLPYFHEGGVFMLLSISMAFTSAYANAYSNMLKKGDY